MPKNSFGGWKTYQNVFKIVTAIIWLDNYLNEDNDDEMTDVYPEKRVVYTFLLLRHRDQLEFSLYTERGSGVSPETLLKRDGVASLADFVTNRLENNCHH